MKPRFVIRASFILLVIFAVMLGWHFRPRPSTPQPIATDQTANSAPATPMATANTTSQRIPSAPPSAISSAIPNVPSTTNRSTPAEALRMEIENKNVPIQFYGMVIDQDSNALAGVDVNVRVVQLTIPDPTVVDFASKSIPVERITGTDGRFEISGVQGASFDLESIQKDGYQAETPKGGHGPTGGTLDQPVIFKMWNTNIHEQLITGEKSFTIVPDGRPYFLDLTAGAINESGTGDLKIWIQYTNQTVRGQLYNWSAEVAVIDGGLFEEQNLNSPMYSAPTDGYAPDFRLQQQIKGGQSGEIGDRRFYVMLKNGLEYGRIAINLYAPYNDQIPGMIRLSYAINPSGSRVLK